MHENAGRDHVVDDAVGPMELCGAASATWVVVEWASGYSDVADWDV